MASPFTFWFDYLNSGRINLDRREFSDRCIPENAIYLGVKPYKLQKDESDPYLIQTADIIIIKPKLYEDLGLADQLPDLTIEKYRFERFLRNLHQEQIKKSKEEIESLSYETKEPTLSSKRKKLTVNLEELKKNANAHFQSIQSILDEFLNCVNLHFKESTKPKRRVSEDGEIMSFDFISKTKLEKVKKLYELLSQDPAYISCTLNEFKKGFTGKKVSKGIYWLDKAKSQLVNKVTLIQLMESLILKGYIQSEKNSIFFRRLKYTFRDIDGSELSNFSQSHQSYLKKASTDIRLIEIVEAL